MLQPQSLQCLVHSTPHPPRSRLPANLDPQIPHLHPSVHLRCPRPKKRILHPNTGSHWEQSPGEGLQLQQLEEGTTCMASSFFVEAYMTSYKFFQVDT